MTNTDLYPPDWPALSAAIKEANGWRCQCCGVLCRSHPADSTKPVLTLAHISQDYEADFVQLAPLCVMCHLRYDAPFGWLARRRRERMRRRRAGQLEWLFAGGGT